MWQQPYQNKIYIDEANKHLQALTDECISLKSQLKDAIEKLEAKDIEVQEIVRDMALRSQENSKDLSERLQKSEARCRKMQVQIESKDTEISILEQKCKLMDEIVKYKPLLAKLTISLEQAEQYSYSNNGSQRQYYSTHSNYNTNSSQSSNNSSTLVEKAAMSLPIYERCQNGNQS